MAADYNAQQRSAREGVMRRHALAQDPAIRDAIDDAFAAGWMARGLEAAPASPLPDPPADLADAWQRFQRGDECSALELRQLDEWRADCARDDGY